MKTTIYIHLFRALSILTFISFLAIPSVSLSEVPILQPGAPGEATRELDAETAVILLILLIQLPTLSSCKI